MLAKRALFVSLLLLLTPTVYGSIFSLNTSFEACAARNDKWGREGPCGDIENGWQTCCWWEPDYLGKDPKVEIRYCQSCKVGPSGPTTDCGPVFTGKTDPGGGVGTIPPDEGVFAPQEDSSPLPEGGVVGERGGGFGTQPSTSDPITPPTPPTPEPEKQPEIDPNTDPVVPPDPSGETKPPDKQPETDPGAPPDDSGDGGNPPGDVEPEPPTSGNDDGGRPDVGTIPDDGVNNPSDNGGSVDAGPIT